MFDAGPAAEDEGVFVHDVELPAQQSDRAGGLEVERAIRVPLQHVPELVGAAGELLVFDAHALLVVAGGGAVRLVGRG